MALISREDERRDKRIYSRVDSNLYKELKYEARKYGMSVSQLLVGMIYFYFDNYKD